jgi:hypothetical protein
MFFRSLAATAILTVSALLPAVAQAPAAAGPLPSPVAHATVQLAGKEVGIRYNAPSMRGRKIMGGLVPFGTVWRTGANDATALSTPIALTIGTLAVPAGNYTIYSLPNADPAKWLLIVNKQTKQWGTEYHQEQDLGRTPMQHATLPKPQEVMSISFEHISKDGKSAELHVRWETTDEWVKVSAR